MRAGDYPWQTYHPVLETLKISLVREYLNQGGYSYGRYGQYFGNCRENRLYTFSSDCGEYFGHVRGSTRAIARALILDQYPNAKVRK